MKFPNNVYRREQEKRLQSVLCLLLAAGYPLLVGGHCTLSFKDFACRGTDLKKFTHTFYETTCETGSFSPNFSIKITHSNFNVIEYFPNLPTTSHNFTITNLAIRNSSVQHISPNAFEELANLEQLDLSRNKLQNILFVESLPTHVKRLHLSHNNITYLDDVFGKLKQLDHLDLSHNKINIINFHNVHWVRRLDFGHNDVKTLIPSTRNSMPEIDLSYNKITEYDEQKLHTFSHMDISHNKLTFINLVSAGERSLLNLSGNDIKILSVNDWQEIRVVDLSSSTVPNWGTIKILATSRLIMANNKIPTLNNTTLNMFQSYRKQLRKSLMPTVDLSNSSIEDISEHYFSNLALPKLDLSSNNITQLRGDIFLGSYVRVLNLSYSNIKRIRSGAFRGLSSDEISLRGNRLDNIKSNFNDVNVKQLDLSFNPLRSIASKSFYNCSVRTLNMSNCLLEQVEPGAFSSLDSLRVLDLSHNKLYIVESNTFNNLPVTDLRLEDTSIDTIRTEAFNNLHNLKMLNLSRSSLRNLESRAFHSMSKLEVVDLSHNNITIVPVHLFGNVNNLGTVYLDGNNITTLNSFSNRLKFHTLTLSFTGIFKANQILNLNIRHLVFTRSNIDILRNNSFAGLYNLVELRLDDTHVRLVEPGALSNLFNLKSLDSQSLFRHAKFLRRSTFRDLRSLQFLNLSNLSLESLEANSFEGLRSLQILLLSKNNLNNLVSGTFRGLVSLKSLDLSDSNIEACDEKTFDGLEDLEILRLEFNDLSRISHVLFEDLGRLLELHLEHNNISTLDIKAFAGLKNVQKLYLQNNNISDFPIGLFHYLPTLRFLNLSNNNIQLLKTGALSNLQSLETLDLSDNELVNLEYVDIFFSLKQLQVVRFDGNHLKQFDFRRFLINLGKIRYVGISHNKWKCDTLSYIIESFNNRSVNYTPEEPVYDDDNIDGIGCVDLCKFVYCSHENVEQTLHYY